MSAREDVVFPTMDGLKLCATLYPNRDAGEGPAIILNPGFNCTKEMFVPDVAVHFQRRGFTALAFDPRSTGASEGQPRNDIDPVKQVEDYSDAATFVAGLPYVDPDKLVFWGYSFSGAVTLCSASVDRRAAAVIAVCPLTQFEYTPEKLPMVLAKCIQDRVSRSLGNKPFYLPMLTEEGLNPAGFGVGIDKENYRLLVNAQDTIAPNFVNETTVQTYSRLYRWQPFKLWELVSPTPVMFVIPERDVLSPAELQRSHFDRLKGPKECLIVPDKGHMDVLDGESSASVLDQQVAFACRSLGLGGS